MYYLFNIISIIEENMKELYMKYYSKNLFNLFNRKIYKDYLNKYENLLFSCYQKVEDNIMYEKNASFIFDLNNQEYKQLEICNALKLYQKKEKELINKNKGYQKNDVLWAVYNELKLKYEYQNDLTMLSVIFDKQTDILMEESKNNQALNTFLCSLYCLLYNYELSTKKINLFDRHFNSRRVKRLKELIEKNNISKNELINYFDLCILENVPNIYNSKKSKCIINEILRRI